MQKITISILTFTGLISLGFSHPREWTSSTDSSKTFKADFISYNKNTKMVTLMKGFKKITFSADKLSEADQAWLEKKSAEKTTAKTEATPKKASDSNPIGDKISRSVLKKLSGKRYKSYKLEAPMPEYYMLSFSASW